MSEIAHPDRLLDGAPGRLAETGVVSSRSWEEGLRELLNDRRMPLHLVGVGNHLRGDDSLGLEIISSLLARIGRRPARNVIVHKVTATLERTLSRIDSSNERVLIFDAVRCSGVPGEVILASLGDSKFGFFATHNIPLSLIPSLSANLENVYVGGVEPGELEVGEGLSDSVRSSVAKITSVVESALRGGPDGFD